MDPSILIRKKFVDFFQKNNHKIIPSSSLVPINDPTLMFTNSGMVQFKNIFTGIEKSKIKKAVTIQKCVRAGGKHNDLENVGHTYRHHTFFEMLGNFSFGDYFKEQAIELAWNLLIKEYKVNKKKLLITIYDDDQDSLLIWKKITGFKDDKIIRLGTGDNFWSVGEIGPCGPCTEIFYDYGDKFDGSILKKGISGDRFVEVWNLVFMEFDQISKSKRTKLPKPCVDTGMGLERITAVLQGTHDNYKTDLFERIIKQSVKLSGKPLDKNNDLSHRIIADHLRSSVHLISDGVLPSNDGRGYVLRRLMRRGMRHAHNLGCRDAIFYQLAPIIIQDMSKFYPELIRAKSLIIETLKNEEIKFKETIDKGLKLLNKEIDKNKGNKFSGDIAFKLYDTFGFPLDLTEDILKSKKISVDTKSFNKNMEVQKKRARLSWKGSGDFKTDELWFKLFDQHGKTDFIGYQTTNAESKILEIIKNKNSLNQIVKGDEAIIIVNQTPFYGESGGQVGDTGILSSDKNIFQVSDTQKIFNNFYLHYGKMSSGNLRKGDTIKMAVDVKKRESITAYHSATHLLHASLRKVLGDHVTQKGSLVASGRLRFDFSHTKPINDDEIKNIENIVNKIIKQNESVHITVMPYKQAVEADAIALFGEKYEDEVRVVSMGKENSKFFSMELCGGTHVEKTGDIKDLKIIKQSSVAAGIRRIEALSGKDLLNFSEEEKKLFQIKEKEKENKKIQEELEEKRKVSSLNDEKKNIIKEGVENSTKYYFRTILDFPSKDLPELVDKSKRELQSGVIVYFSEYNKSISIVAGVTKDITSRINAIDITKKSAEILGASGGGGRVDFARAGGGSNINKISEVYDSILDLIRNS